MNNTPSDNESLLMEKLANYREKLLNEPKCAVLWIEYGDFVDNEYDMPDEVVRAYENAARLLPNKDLRLRLGGAYIIAGKPDVGLSLIKDSVSENPRAHGFCFLADAYLQLEDYESAKQAAEQAIIEDVDFEEGYYLLGEATRRFSRTDAIGCFRKAIQLDYTYALAWQALGRELAADDDTIHEAVTALRRAIELDPEDGWAMAFLADALGRIGRTGEADNWYRRAISAFPGYEEMKRRYAEFRAATRAGPNGES